MIWTTMFVIMLVVWGVYTVFDIIKVFKVYKSHRLSHLNDFSIGFLSLILSFIVVTVLISYIWERLW